MKRLPNVLLMKNADFECGRRFIAGISEYAQHFGPWRIHWISEREEGPPAPLTWSAMDGVIGTNALNLEAVKRAGVPVIVECTTEIEFPGMISVMSNDVALGRVAAHHFLERGFRNFAFFGGTLGTYEQHREQAFRAALDAEGFDLQPFGGSGTASTLPKQMKQWMENLPKPVAVLTPNDEYAKSVLEVCRMVDVRVPEECAVLGMDNDELLCNLCNPPLSSIKIPFRKAGYEVAAQLDRMMRGEEAETDLILIEAGDVVVRQSTDIVAVDDPAVSKAVAVMIANPHRKVSLDELARASGVSRRSLEMRFQSKLSTTVQQYHRRIWADHVARVLRESTLSIEAVSEQCGFSHGAALSRFFRSVTGETPLAYRKRVRR